MIKSRPLLSSSCSSGLNFEEPSIISFVTYIEAWVNCPFSIHSKKKIFPFQNYIIACHCFFEWVANVWILKDLDLESSKFQIGFFSLSSFLHWNAETKAHSLINYRASHPGIIVSVVTVAVSMGQDGQVTWEDTDHNPQHHWQQSAT